MGRYGEICPNLSVRGARDHPRSFEITRDGSRSPEIARDHPRSLEITQALKGVVGASLGLDESQLRPWQRVSAGALYSPSVRADRPRERVPRPVQTWPAL